MKIKSHDIVLDYEDWQEFINKLNNPSKETIEAREKFIQECNTLSVIYDNNGSGSIECPNLNVNEIITELNTHLGGK